MISEIINIEQVLSAEPKAAADISDITKTESNNSFIVHSFKKKATNTPSHGTQFDNARKSYTARATYRLVS